MKKTIFPIMFLVFASLITAVSIYIDSCSNDNICYQETATSTSTCGGLDTGAYYFEGSWDGSYPSSNFNDGDYATYSLVSAGSAYAWVNYTKPNNKTGAIWQIKNYDGISNQTIPDTCWNAHTNILELRAESHKTADWSNWTCMAENGELNTVYRISGTGRQLYEEAIFWINYTTALNISFYDENGVNTTVDYETTINYWENETSVHNFSADLTNIQETQICYYYGNNVTGNQQIRYTDAENNIYDYFTYKTAFDSTLDQLKLYTQNGTTQTLFTVQTLDTDPVQNAYIHILKYDVGTGSYTTTEVLKTDSQGQALGNIILGTAFYNFFIYYNGNLIYSENAVKLITTTRTFSVSLIDTDWNDDFDITLGVNTNLYYNNGTYNFVYTWTDPTSSMHYACLRVDKVNDSGKYNLSDSCTESASGTILYNTGVPQNGTEYIGTGYLKFDNIVITDVVSHLVPNLRELLRLDSIGSLFIAFVFIITMMFIGVPNPSLALMFLGGGVIFTSIFGLYMISALQIGSIAVLILIQIYLFGRQR